jgi:hypothetical protein
VDFHTPFMIMIGLFELASIGPFATFHLGHLTWSDSCR